jgi:hypothetical protein
MRAVRCVRLCGKFRSAIFTRRVNVCGERAAIGRSFVPTNPTLRARLSRYHAGAKSARRKVARQTPEAGAARAIIPTFRLCMIVATIPQGIRICIAAAAAMFCRLSSRKGTQAQTERPRRRSISGVQSSE